MSQNGEKSEKNEESEEPSLKESTQNSLNKHSDEHSTKAHVFIDATFGKPTFCQWCDGFIWGFTNQGFSCKVCGYCIHRRCLPSVPSMGCGEKLKEPSYHQLEEARRAFADQLGNESAINVFTPTNDSEEYELAMQVEDKIVEGIKQKHAPHALKTKIFGFDDIVPMMNDAVSSIAEDEFTECFQTQSYRPWNWNIYLFPLWVVGIIVRYLILFPIRLTIIVFGLSLTLVLMTLSSYIKNKETRTSIQLGLIKFVSGVFIASWAGVIRYHGIRPKKRPNQVFVANHTTVFDIVILSNDFNYSFVGQKHPGTIGFVQDTILECLGCLWFDRKDADDRAKIARLIKSHVHNPDKLPLLLFPEGTCVNNEYCVMFKKGAFEIENSTVWPIAIKYNKLFSDPFWNSREQSFPRHLFRLLTSWCVVCDVRYLEPQTIAPGESSSAFADRVKALIARKGGLINVPWDGYLKYFRPSERFISERQKIFASSVQSRFSCLDLVELERYFDSPKVVHEEIKLEDGSSPSDDNNRKRKGKKPNKSN
eukprot:TRINITY_DN3393_c0_g1_i2.p1 TRINITY_DN3393_c0_g1~~TRINITY_DN3393_c0_g1_i2.p1  ORF type:complete len:536 (+),score=166.51 TRINITY_DN3393_c0_g1_i2:90-1697(+)